MDNVYSLLAMLGKQWVPENRAQVPRIEVISKNVITLMIFHDGEWHEFSLPKADWERDPKELLSEITKLMKAKSA